MIVLLVCMLPLLSGCDEGALNAPDIADGGDTEGLFNSYVAIGNSITAGLQSAGINETTQKQSYAALLADSVLATPFGIPALAAPGCPPPIQSFPPSPPATDCALRSPSASSVNNVAVPNAKVIDALSNAAPSSSPNALTQFILGGRTQIGAALEKSPTFATIWIGNNDVLSAANAGTPALATDVNTFAQQYRTLTDSLRNNAPLEGAVLIGVADVSAIPGIFEGEVYFGLEQQIGNQFPPSFDVASSCAPNALGGQGSTNQVSFLFFLGQLSDASDDPTAPSGTYGISCGDTDPGSLTPGEIQTLSDRASNYNDEIEQIAAGDDNPFVFFNPNDEFRQLAGQAPSPPDFTSQQPFGPFFSLDGIHPSPAAHQLVTNRLVQVINAEFGTNLSPLEDAPQLP